MRSAHCLSSSYPQGAVDAHIIMGERALIPSLSRPTTSGCPIAVAFKAFLTALVEHPPRPIPVDTDPIDLQDRAEHLTALFSALAAYLAVVLDDTAQNATGRLDLTDAEAILADLASDLTGAIQRAADQMADDMLGRVE
jgi:hypothetical protein